MAFDFPASPTVGQQFSPVAGTVYTYNGYGWALATGAIGLIAPQGRLTLQTLTPVMTPPQAAKTTIYYTPYQGNLCPIYNGVNFAMSAFSELSVLTTDTTKSPAAIGASKVNDWFVWNDAGTLRIGHDVDWTNDTTPVGSGSRPGLTRVAGIWTNQAAITNGPAINRGTYVGTTRSNASSQLDWIYGGLAATGSPGFFGVWNAYNRVTVTSLAGDSNVSAPFSVTAFAVINAGVKHSFVCGLAEDVFDFSHHMLLQASASGFVGGGIGYDSTTAKSGSTAYSPPSITTLSVARYSATALGFHFGCELVCTPGGGSGSIWGNGGSSANIQSGMWFTGRM